MLRENLYLTIANNLIQTAKLMSVCAYDDEKKKLILDIASDCVDKAEKIKMDNAEIDNLVLDIKKKVSECQQFSI